MLLNFFFFLSYKDLFWINSRLVNKIFFDIIAMTPRGTLGLCCAYITQLTTHTAIYTLPFTLQLCYKPLDILQRVTKSQRVHISSHDKLYTKTKNYIYPYTKKVTENWFCNKIAVQVKFHFKRTFINAKKSRKIASVIRSRFRVNSVSNGLSLILEESRKIGSAIRSWFRLILHFKKVKITIVICTIMLVFPGYQSAFKISHKNFIVFNKICHIHSTVQ